MKELKLYSKEVCPYCQKVLRVIDKYNLNVEIRDIKKDPAAQDELLAIGGKDQVPMLLVDGKPMYESGDIVKYLKDHHIS